jgi:hypothetical protein
MQVLADQSCCRTWLARLERHGLLHNATELRACLCGRRYYVEFACVRVGGVWSCNVVDAVPAPPADGRQVSPG